MEEDEEEYAGEVEEDSHGDFGEEFEGGDYDEEEGHMQEDDDDEEYEGHHDMDDAEDEDEDIADGDDAEEDYDGMAEHDVEEIEGDVDEEDILPPPVAIKMPVVPPKPSTGTATTVNPHALHHPHHEKAEHKSFHPTQLLQRPNAVRLGAHEDIATCLRDHAVIKTILGQLETRDEPLVDAQMAEAEKQRLKHMVGTCSDMCGDTEVFRRALSGPTLGANGGEGQIFELFECYKNSTIVCSVQM